MPYSPPASPLNVSWTGAVAYGGTTAKVRASWGDGTTQYLYEPPSISAEAFGAPSARLGRFILSPAGFGGEALGTPQPLTTLFPYARPQYSVNASWVGAQTYQGPSGAVPVSFNVFTRTLGPAGMAPGVFGDATVYKQQFITATGLSSFISGEPFVLRSWQYRPPQFSVNANWAGARAYTPPAGTCDASFLPPGDQRTMALTGWDSSAYGQPTVITSSRAVSVSGIAPGAAGTPSLRWTRFIRPSGLIGDIGTPAVRNQRQFLVPSGLAAGAFGSHRVYDPFAPQRVTVAGFTSAAFGALSVSPRFVYAVGIGPLNVGTPGVTRNPSPLGWDSSVFGDADVSYRTKILQPAGIAAGPVGQPDVTDLHQDVYVSSIVQEALFGDAAVKNRLSFVRPEGFEEFVSNSYTLVENFNREIKPFGVAPKPVASPLPADDPLEILPSPVWPETNEALSSGALALLLDDDSWTRYVRTSEQSLSVADGVTTVIGFTNGQTVFADSTYVVTQLVGPTRSKMRIYERATGAWVATVERTSTAVDGSFFFADRDGNSYSTGGAGSQLTADTGYSLTPVTGGIGMQWGSDLLIWRPGRMFGVPIGDYLTARGKYFVRCTAVTSQIEVRELHPTLDTTTSTHTLSGSFVRYAASISGDSLFFYGTLNGVVGLHKVNLITGSTVTTISSAVLDAGWRYPNERGPVQVLCADGKVFVHCLSVLRVFDESLTELRAPQLTGLGASIPENGNYHVYSAAAFNGYLTIGGQTRSRVAGEVVSERRETVVFRTSDGKLHRPASINGQTAVWNSGQAVRPVGLDSLAMGDTRETGVGYPNRAITPFSIVATSYGSPTLTKTPSFTPAGFDSASFGSALVAPRVRLVLATGSQFSEYGEPILWDRVRTVRNAGGQDLSLYGVTDVGPLHRTVDLAGLGPDTAAFGVQKAELKVRALLVDGIGFNYSTNRQFGTARVSDGTQRTTALGILPGEFGTLTIARNERVLQPAGIPGEAGTPDVQLWKRYLLAHGGEMELHGLQSVYNSRQYIEQAEGVAELLWGTAYVENRNKVIRTYGVDTSRLTSGASVLNNARLVAPAGIEALYGNASVTHRVRYIVATGLAGATPSYWSSVYNTRAILEPSGIGRGRMGVPYVRDNTQRVDCNGSRTLMTEYGVPMVAPRIRSLSVDRFGIDVPTWPMPYVGLYQQYIEPQGPEGRFGAPNLEISRNIISLHGAEMTLYGEPFVRNKTPQLYAGSMEAPTNPQKPWVSFRVRPVAPLQFETVVFGRAYVGQRTRYVTPNGINSLRIPLLHRVEFDAPVIPPVQRIEPYSISEPLMQPPTLNRRSMFAEGFVATRFGAPFITSTVLYPSSCVLVDSEQVSEPRVIGPQFIQCKSSQTDEGMSAPGWIAMPARYGIPFVNPYYLRISEDFNGQLILPEALVDYRDASELYDRPAFGRPSVELKNRRITTTNVVSVYGPFFGEASVTLRVRKLTPTGLFSMRFGFPELPSGGVITPYWGRDTEDWIEGEDYDTALYGTADVAHAPVYDPYLRPAGATSEDFGAPRVELRIRVVAPSGAPSAFASVGHWVHPPIPVVPNGFAGEVGTPTVDFKIRSLRPEGFESFGTDYEAGSFHFGVLRVRRRNTLNTLGSVASIIPSPIVINADLGAVATLGDQSAFGRPRLGACAC